MRNGGYRTVHRLLTRLCAVLALAGPLFASNEAAANGRSCGVGTGDPAGSIFVPIVQSLPAVLPGDAWARLRIGLPPSDLLAVSVRFSELSSAPTAPEGTHGNGARPQSSASVWVAEPAVRPVQRDSNQTEVGFPVPATRSFWGDRRRLCIEVARRLPGGNGSVSGAAQIYDGEVRISGKWLPSGVAVLSVATVYPTIAFAAWLLEIRARRRNPGAGLPPAPSFAKTLDPVQITRGEHGRASLAKLQVFCFSLLIFGLLVFAVLRFGVLMDLSESVLYLLGISAAGATAGKVTYAAKDRLSLTSWSWLMHVGWLTKGGDVVPRARWSDLFSDGREFDVYRFQLAIFSVLVAAALLVGPTGDLADFDIPPSLLMLLGLSQSVYVVGRAIEPASRAELDRKIDTLRKLEQTMLAKAGDKVTANLARDELRRAVPEEFAAYTKEFATALDMFNALYANDRLAPKDFGVEFRKRIEQGLT